MLAVILAACIPQARGVMYIIAVLVSVSRLYLQKHYLTDVIAGVVLGICFGAVANVLYPGGCGVNLP
jgi:membrane-associated phospholipid phosphatase